MQAELCVGIEVNHCHANHASGGACWRNRRGRYQSLKLYGFLGALLHTGILFGQQAAQPVGGGVVGYVTAQVSGQPLGLADAVVTEFGIATFADTNGVFRFRGLPPGTFTIRLRRIGFAPASIKIVVVAGATDTVRVSLVRFALQLDRVRTNDVVCPVRPGGDTTTLALIEQIRGNAQRNLLVSHEFPFVSRMERTIANEQSSSGVWGSDMRRSIVSVDTLLIGSEHDWGYTPGNLVVSNENNPVAGAPAAMMLPQLLDFASDSFVDDHCFRFAAHSG
jgi:hypothetical protein